MHDINAQTFLADFGPKDDALYELAREYHERTEAYDRTVCTGPVGPDGILPGTAKELGLINVHARQVLHELQSRLASNLAPSPLQLLCRAIAQHRPREHPSGYSWSNTNNPK